MEVSSESASERRPLFVVEADEYDTAFFDKRSKFVHYRPLVAILNNPSTTTPTSSRTWPPSSASSTISCALCRTVAA